MIRRARASVSASGANASFAGPICLGWIRVLPSKPSSAPCRHAAANPVVVLQVEMHAVQNRQAAGARGQQAEAERGEQRQAQRRVRGVQLLGQIRGAHDQAGEARVRRGDRLGAQHGARRLHHAPQRQIRRAAGVVQHGERLAHRIGALDLGDQHGVGARPRGRGEIRLPPRGRQRVDAHDRLARAIAACPQRGAHLLARARLGLGRDRVLEIEDQRIRRQALRLVERARIGARHVEHAAAGTDASRHPAIFR